MNSLTLKEMGFSQPCSLKTVSISSIPSDSSSVLALIDTSLTGKAESDILYIGRSKKPAKKILGGYLAGYGGKNTKKINAILSDGYIEKTAISWISCDKPKAMQRELLDKYVKEHGKVPMWNASKKKIEKVQKVGKEKKKSTTTVSGKVAKAEKPAPPKKAKAVKPASPKSTVPAKVAISTKPTEPSTSASSNHTGAESA